MKNQDFSQKYIEINAILGEINTQRTKFLDKFLPQKGDSDEIVILKEIYLEDVPNLKNLLEHLELYTNLFKNLVEKNKQLILHLEGKEIKTKTEKPEEPEDFIEVKDDEEEGEEDERL